MVENAGPAQVRVFRSGNTNDAVSVHLISRGEPTVLLQKVLWMNFEVLIVSGYTLSISLLAQAAGPSSATSK